MKALRWITLHLLLAALAFLVVRVVITRTAAARHPAPDESAARSKDSRMTKRAARTGRSLDAAGYRAMWEEIAKRRLNRMEREQLQSALLKEWAQTDLNGALQAVLRESWRSDLFPKGHPFASVFVDRSEDVLKLIRERELGILETTLLTKAWMASLLEKDKELYLTYLGSLDESGFMLALEAASPRIGEPGFMAELLAVAATHEGFTFPSRNVRFLDAAVQELGKEGLLQALEKSKGAISEFYAGALAVEFHESAPNADAAEVEARISGLPEDKRRMFAVSLLRMSSANPAVRQTALLSLVQDEAWQDLDRDTSGNVMRWMATTMEAPALAEWVSALPARKETSELFHRGVEPYIRENPAAAWQWIEGLQNPFWRDRALAEYSQVNLHVFNNPDESARAIGEIRDAAFRDTVRDWRSSWEKQHRR